MFDKYMLCEDSLRNLSEGGRVTGFQVDVRICYYRGLGLSMVEGFDVIVDGETFPRESVRFRVGDRTYDYSAMEQAVDDRWEFGERATIVLPKPGGLKSGAHEVSAVQTLRVSYMPFPIQGKDKKTLALQG
jgi:Domain of unknown function (DUF6379)